MLSLAIIGLIFVVGVLAEWLAPYCHTAQDLAATNQLPSPSHLFGTDELGRDLLSRIIWGARTAVIVAIGVAVLNLSIGLVMGSVAGYFGGKVDGAIMRLADFLFAFPDFFFVLFVAATLKPAVINWVKTVGAAWGLKRGAACGADYVGFADFFVVVAALALVGWPGMARLVRGQFLSLKEQEFVQAAKAVGVPARDIIFRHILPNASPPIIVAVSFMMGGAIFAEVGLSFIGVGIQPPNASWGTTILDNYLFWRTRPHMIIIPGLIVAATIYAFSFLGDGLNEALNPQIRSL